MNPPLYAGFETAKLHWNGHDTVLSTKHTPETNLHQNYAHAEAQGAVGFRDGLLERFSVAGRWFAARQAVRDRPIIWNLVHFDQPTNPLRHAEIVATIASHHNDRFIAVNEPSVPELNLMSIEAATDLAVSIMDAMLAVRPGAKFWTCDPAHHADPAAFTQSLRIAKTFPQAVEVIGINYHACHAHDPLRDILKCAADTTGGHQLALTETSLHDNAGRGMQMSRHQWIDYVYSEIDASGVPLECVCWYPWVDMAFEPGDPWPNGWPKV